ncbi:hypothetical protein HWI79_136 [Cryptosporidium felis]|nr:hypothetical protein HWI79_136 [Cryptosporidium felis]
MFSQSSENGLILVYPVPFINKSMCSISNLNVGNSKTIVAGRSILNSFERTLQISTAFNDSTPNERSGSSNSGKNLSPIIDSKTDLTFTYISSGNSLLL